MGPPYHTFTKKDKETTENIEENLLTNQCYLGPLYHTFTKKVNETTEMIVEHLVCYFHDSRVPLTTGSLDESSQIVLIERLPDTKLTSSPHSLGEEGGGNLVFTQAKLPLPVGGGGGFRSV